MIIDNIAPAWTGSAGQEPSADLSLGPPPFLRYMAFRRSPHYAGIRIEPDGFFRLRVSAAVVTRGSTHIWLEFAELPQTICLADQAHVVLDALRASRRCGIVIRMKSQENSLYEVPVRIKLLKPRPLTKAREVRYGTWAKDVSRQRCDGGARPD